MVIVRVSNDSNSLHYNSGSNDDHDGGVDVVKAMMIVMASAGNDNNRGADAEHHACSS